jgi:protein MAK16
MIIRRRRLKLNQIEKFEAVKTKFEKREKAREKRAERAANLELSIEKELLNRLKEGVYPKEIYNIDQREFEKAIAEEEVEEEQEYEVDDISDYDEESEEEYEKELVEADLDEVDDLEDIDEDMAAAMDDDEGEGDEDVKRGRKGGRMVEIEYEMDENEKQTY